MNYAVIESGGKQYKVQKGDIIQVDRLEIEESKTVTFDKVLLLVEEKTVKVGKPYLKNASVKGKVLENKKGEKTHVLRFRAKSRYRRRTGHRPHISEIEISSINDKK